MKVKSTLAAALIAIVKVAQAAGPLTENVVDWSALEITVGD